ncbi:S41 family peptidase [Telluribacter humicola]|uniref:S41 family peptidase n=1 Tax=Telluribacter humicola TaxID=1720261 RepID=UPI001A96BD9E|nr:S41 family peptidase [Telluribacter humicola]
MKTNSLHRKTIDWDSFTTQVLGRAKGAQNIDEPSVNAAIIQALTLLDDSHSLFITHKGSYLYGAGRQSCSDEAPALPALGNDIGYIKISGFSGGGSDAQGHAETIQNEIRRADSPTLRGWIIDLRGNTGGNMWPMLAGVEPILGEGTLGYFVDPDGNTFAWTKDYPNYSKVTFPYTLYKPNPKVAVLTDRLTASSGEAVAIAFRGRPNTRSFGKPTCGLSTANARFPLLNGASLVLTVATMADRTSKEYGKTVEPDVLEANQQLYLEKALAWLREP